MHISRVPFGSPDYKDVLQLRDEVLRQPLGLSLYDEDLSDEKNQIILAAYDNNKVIGCVLLKAEAPGIMRLRAMAVSEPYRGRGIARDLVRQAEELAMQKGALRIILHAREAAMPFYQTLGYTAAGEPYIEIGIPHHDMQKVL